MTEERAKAFGLKAKIYIRDFIYVAQNPLELPMSGGVFAIPALLERCGLTIKDIDVWETLEDFAVSLSLVHYLKFSIILLKSDDSTGSGSG